MFWHLRELFEQTSYAKFFFLRVIGNFDRLDKMTRVLFRILPNNSWFRLFFDKPRTFSARFRNFHSFCTFRRHARRPPLWIVRDNCPVQNSRNFSGKPRTFLRWFWRFRFLRVTFTNFVRQSDRRLEILSKLLHFFGHTSCIYFRDVSKFRVPHVTFSRTTTRRPPISNFAG